MKLTIIVIAMLPQSALAQQSVPKPPGAGGFCPHGYAASGPFYVSRAGAQDAIPSPPNGTCLIELTPVLRGTVYDPAIMGVVSMVEDAFCFAEKSGICGGPLPSKPITSLAWPGITQRTPPRAGG